MKNTTYTFDKAPSFTPTFTPIPGLNTNPIDYQLLINRP